MRAEAPGGHFGQSVTLDSALGAAGGGSSVKSKVST